MRNFKSERLKKLEAELADLEQWLKLGLVPKKDMKKHEEEIQAISAKIDEEKERLQFLKESGDWEEYVTPKRSQGRSGYSEMPTIPDLGGEEGNSNSTTEEYGDETSHGYTTASGETNETSSDTESGSFFGRKRRWEGIIDPEGDAW